MSVISESMRTRNLNLDARAFFHLEIFTECGMGIDMRIGFTVT